MSENLKRIRTGPAGNSESYYISGHTHACGDGKLNHPADFEKVRDTVEENLGIERARQMHMHFLRIKFGKKGEIRYKTFADTDYGPEFLQLAPLLAKRNYHGTLICESRKTMAEDACSMKMMFRVNVFKT